VASSWFFILQDTGSLELESTVECNVDFLRRKLTLGKIK